jgi:hypothetical protein
MRKHASRRSSARWRGSHLLRRIVLILAALSPAVLPAQVRGSVACDGQAITEIRIESHGPSLGKLPRQLAGLNRIAEFHVTTQPNVIRQLLLLSEGQRCSELRRAESERMLRAQSFIAEATILAYPVIDGGVWLHVVTVDEFSLIAGLGAGSESPYVSKARGGNSNWFGRGVLAEIEWEDGASYRDAFGGRIRHQMLFGKPYQLSVHGARRSLGREWGIEATHPYFTDLQRTAWHASAGETRGYFGFIRGDMPVAALALSRAHADIGGIIRIGEPGRLSLFGASITSERERADGGPVVVGEFGLVPDATTEFEGRYGAHQTARLNALWGVRNTRYFRATGFDALTGSQDVRTGFQLGVLAGRSLAVLGSRDDDIFLSAELYAGLGGRRAFAGLQVIGEGRQNYNANSWDGVLGSGRLASYLRLAETHTLIASAEWSGGWRQRVPYQVSLADFDGGIRGYRKSAVGGARRAVLRVEERWAIGQVNRAADVGLATFVDVGRLWAGDAPFGVDTPVQAGFGLGLLAAVPAGSRRLWRLDISIPVDRDIARGSWEVRLGSTDLSRVFWREPKDVARSRERAAPGSVFNWP